jgi:hypothetical protein
LLQQQIEVKNSFKTILFASFIFKIGNQQKKTFKYSKISTNIKTNILYINCSFNTKNQKQTHPICIKVNVRQIMDPDNQVLIEGVLFRARYLGSTQLITDGNPTKLTRMLQAQEAVGRIKVRFFLLIPFFYRFTFKTKRITIKTLSN